MDSNVESPSTNGPSAAHIGIKLYNDSDVELTDVTLNIGHLLDEANGNGTPGVFPARLNPQGYTGTFSLQMPGGAADALRVIPRIAPHSYVVQYFFITYPLKDDNGQSLAGAAPVTFDDLRLQYDVWASTGVGVNTLRVNETNSVTLRNEISAQANKIWPNTDGKVPDDYLQAIEASLGWRPNVSNARIPGAVVMEGIWYDLGNVGAGFDNDGDGIPDRNAWLQPVGDPVKFSPLAARLVKCYGLVIVKLNDGTEKLIPFEDQLYFEHLPANNTGVVGLVYYEFIPLDRSLPSQLSPYQEVASGYDNEKFNGDYGASVGAVSGNPPKVTFDKSGPTLLEKGSVATYVLSATSNETIGSNLNFGWPELGLPLVFEDAIPNGMVYFAGSATAANAPPPGASYTVTWSIDNAVTWQSTEPADAAAVTTIRWTLNGTLAPGQSAAVQFQARLALTYVGVSIGNTGCLKKGNETTFACDTVTTQVSGINSLGDLVWRDLDRDGTPDGGDETGIANVSVNLYYDTNGNGIHDAGDTWMATQTTDVSGNYTFANLPDGKFVAVIDGNDPDIPVGFSLPNSIGSTLSADLDSAGTNPDPLLISSLDWPWIPALGIVKSVSPTTYEEGELIHYKIDLTNYSAASVGNLTPNETAYAKAVTQGGSTQQPTNAVGPNDGNYAFIDWHKASDSLTTAAPAAPVGSTPLTFSNPSGTITKVELVIRGFLSRAMSNNGTMSVSLGGVGFTSVSTAQLNTMVGLPRDYVIDITSKNATWTWAMAEALTASLAATKAGGAPDNGTLNIDSIGFRVTTAGNPGTYGMTTISPLPLTDTFDNSRLEYVSASIAPSAVSGGVISWNDVGPLNAGSTKTVTVTFRARSLTDLTGDGRRDAATTTNSASVTNAYFVSGRRANDASSAVAVTIQPTGSIGDYVFWDVDGSGTQNAGDVGLSNVVVSLYSGTGVLLGQTLTSSTGFYQFTGLGDGSYYVYVETNKNGDTFSLPWTTVSQTFDPNGSPYSGTGPTVVINNADTVTTNDNYTNQDFGFDNNTRSLISGTLFMDNNGNGVMDVGENPIAGQTITLSGSATGTTTTDGNGFYFFGDLAAGTYTVTVSPPPANTTQTLDPDATINSATTVAVAAGAVYPNRNFAYKPTGTLSIGDTLYLDWNGNGIQDGGEQGIANVDIWLYEDSNGDGAVSPATDSLIATSVTQANGSYGFTGLAPGTYVVMVNTGDAQFPAAVYQTQDFDGVRNHMAVVNLSASLDTVDFGYQPHGSGAIGNAVWFDANHNGIKDVNEMGIDGVLVQLFRSGQTPGVDTPYASTTTAGGGLYQFSQLPADSYTVYLPTSNFAVDGPLELIPWSSSATSTLDDAVDNDDNGIQSGSGAAVASPVVVLANGEVDLSKDFGFVGVGSLGDMVYYDLNANGLQDYNEPGIPNVTVKLFADANADGLPDSGTPLATTVTASTGSNPPGYYRFELLPPGSYYIQVDSSTLPAGLVQSADPDLDGVPVAAPEHVGDHADSLAIVGSGSNYSGGDFGYHPAGAVGNFVWLDLNQDGVQDPGEPGLAGVTLTVSNGPSTYSLVTDPNGEWSSMLADGTWTVQIDSTNFASGGVLENLAPSFDADGIGSENETTLVIANGNVDLAAGNFGIDFGYKLAGLLAIEGTVAIHDTGIQGVADDIDDFYDDGVDMDAGVGDEVELAGFEVFLYGSDGRYLGSALTDARGHYSFSGLPSGDYRVVLGSVLAPLDLATLTTTSSNNLPGATITDNGSSVVYALTMDLENVRHVDFMFNSLVNYDFGDLPASYEMTTLGNDGARHRIPGTGTTVYLGSAPEADINGVQSATADGDDKLGSDDEDGVTMVAPDTWINGPTGGQLQIDVHGNGWLVGWIDWNHDGDFLDTDEMVVNRAVSNGSLLTTIPIPDGTISGTSESWLARFRVFAEEPPFALFSYTAETIDGEVEDYLLEKPVGGSIGDRVWRDDNGNGTLDPNEDGIAGRIVELRDGSGQLLDDQITGDGLRDVDEDGVVDPLGYYRFRGLADGNYTVTVTNPPAGFLPSYVENPTGTPHVTSVTLLAGTQHASADFGYVPQVANLSGQVRYDADSDGDPGDADTPAMGVKIQLWTDPNGDGNFSDGVQTGETFTDGSGNYQFTNVPTGSYVVVEINPANSTSTYDVQGDPIDDRIAVTMAGVAVTGRNFLDTQPPVYAIRGSVYDDSSRTNNQEIDASDHPLAGIAIKLFFDRDGSGTLTAGDTELASTVTSVTGSYEFTGLPISNYVVQQIDRIGTLSEWDAGGSLTDSQIAVALVNADVTGRDFLDDGYAGTCPSDWAEWKFTHPGESAGANPDGDDYDNFAEFAFAMPYDSGVGSQWLGSTAWVIQPSSLNPDLLDAVFVRPKGAPENVTYTLQYAAAVGDPTVWLSRVITPDLISTVDNGDCTETVTVHDLEALTGLAGGTGVVRIKAELDEVPESGVDHTSHTETEGWRETTLPAGCRTYSNPYLRESLFTGTVDSAEGSVAGQTLQLSVSSGSADLSALMQPGHAYFLEVVSGAHEGDRFDLQSASVAAVTVANDSDLASGAPPFNTVAGNLPTTLAGCRVVIRRHWKLGDLFPAASFNGSADPKLADQVQTYALNEFTTYWLDSSTGPNQWVRFGDSADQSGTIIPSGTGIFVWMSTAGERVLAYGEIRANDFVCPLAAGTQFVGAPYPVDQAATGAASRQMNQSAGFFGSRDFKTADSFYVWRGNGAPGVAGYDSYYLLNRDTVTPAQIKWVKVGDAKLTSWDADPLFRADASTLIRLKNNLERYKISAPWQP